MAVAPLAGWFKDRKGHHFYVGRNQVAGRVVDESEALPKKGNIFLWETWLLPYDLLAVGLHLLDTGARSYCSGLLLELRAVWASFTSAHNKCWSLFLGWSRHSLQKPARTSLLRSPLLARHASCCGFTLCDKVRAWRVDSAGFCS